MPKISQYTQVQSVKSTDKVVLNQTVNGETDTYSATIEQIGDNIAGTQSHASLNTSDETLIGAINEIVTKIAYITYTLNDSFSIRYAFFAGSLTGSKKIITFWIPTERPIDTSAVDNCTISVTNFRIYLSNDTVQIANSDGTWSFNVRRNGIQATFTLTNALTTADGAITVYFGSSASITLTHTTP